MRMIQEQSRKLKDTFFKPASGGKCCPIHGCNCTFIHGSDQALRVHMALDHQNH
jgi:hypothetical protein